MAPARSHLAMVFPFKTSFNHRFVLTLCLIKYWLVAPFSPTSQQQRQRRCLDIRLSSGWKGWTPQTKGRRRQHSTPFFFFKSMKVEPPAAAATMTATSVASASSEGSPSSGDQQQHPDLVALAPDYDWNKIISHAKSIVTKPVPRIGHNLALLRERFGDKDAQRRIEADGFLLMHPEKAIPVGEEWEDYMGQRRMGGTKRQRKKYRSQQKCKKRKR